MDAHTYYGLLSRRELPVVVDSAAAGPELSQRGFTTIAFDDFDFSAPASPAVLIVLTDLERNRQMLSHWKTVQAIVCHLALAKFDSAAHGLRYALDQLLAVDIAATLARRAAHYESLLSCQRMEVQSAGSTLVCHLRDELEIPNMDSALRPEWLFSVTEFLESSMVNLDGERSSFWVEGELQFAGLAHLCNSAAQKAEYASFLQEIRLLSAGGQNKIVFADNTVVRLILGGKDRSDLLQATFSGKERGTAVTEIGLGCADFSGPADWRISSPMHKVRQGAYVGVGMGWQLPHLDFIAPGATCRFVASEEG